MRSKHGIDKPKVERQFEALNASLTRKFAAQSKASAAWSRTAVKPDHGAAWIDDSTLERTIRKLIVHLNRSA